MELEKIEKLAHDWRTVTWQVIKLEKPDLLKVCELFGETYELFDKYSTENHVPKDISGVILEMHDFCWWVCDLDATPLHDHYQEICTLVCELNKYFLTRDASVQVIEKLIRSFDTTETN